MSSSYNRRDWVGLIDASPLLSYLELSTSTALFPMQGTGTWERAERFTVRQLHRGISGAQCLKLGFMWTVIEDVAVYIHYSIK